MSTCNSCGGMLGRDCFNPRECAEITANINQFDHQQAQRDIAQANGRYHVLLDLVREVRAAQKQYFKSRNLVALTKSKALERQLDDLIKEKPLTAQTDLF